MEEVWTMVEEKWKHLLLLMIGVIVLLILLLVNKEAVAEKETAPAEMYEELLADEAETNDSSATSKEIEEEDDEKNLDIMVDVKGAVLHPGVYKMQADERVIDAIQMAGGLMGTAEERNINFAQILVDQMVIYVPEIGEESFEGASPISQPENETNQEKVDINTADKQTLTTLSGIGDSKADAIIRYREESGFFETIEDIKNVPGIGDATFENIKEFIRISP